VESSPSLIEILSKGINRIAGNIYLDLETLTNMSFIRNHGPSHNYQYVWKVNNDNCLIILPNPEVVENLLYVGINPQVHDDGGNEEEVGENLHHEQETSVNYNDERWAWMQTEVQRISTEQQRQGVEMAGIRNNVQRGNRKQLNAPEHDATPSPSRFRLWTSIEL